LPNCDLGSGRRLPVATSSCSCHDDPPVFEKRTVIVDGRRVADEVWLPADAIRAAVWNEKVRWTLADLLPEEALPPEQTGTSEILVRCRESSPC
jgi:hypothetical protein